MAAALLVGVCAGACKDGGSRSPGQATSVEGGSSCPPSVPRRGSSCPRGEAEFCVYRTGDGDFLCSCGGGKWGCGKK